MRCPRCDFDNVPQSTFCAKCGSRLDPSLASLEVTQLYTFPLAGLEAGTVFAGRYQVLEELGSGGMGKVYKVIDKEVNEKIAIKLLKPEISFDEGTIERFRNELKLARKISHPNVCRMYDLIKERGLYFITMEYVSGEDLKSTIERVGQLSVGKALAIAEQICKGLVEAHKLNVVHRDLKPHNIIIDRNGDARIMDFGIAQSLTTKGVTESGVMIGTPEYMSPEQALGEASDQRSDIYSLGIILFELLTGTVPFKGDTAVGVALKQKTELPPDPKSLNPQIPDEVSQLILRCLEKDKEKRYQSAALLLEELTQIHRGFPTTDRLVPKKPQTTLKKKPRKRFLPFVNPAVLVIALLAVAAGFVIIKVGMSLFPKKTKEIIATQIQEQGRSFDLPLGRIEMMDAAYGVSEIEGVVSDKIDTTGDVSEKRWNIAISSVPSGALVYLDEDKKGQRTPFRIWRAAGSHRIKIEHPDYLDESGQFQVESEKPFQKTYELKPAYIIDIISDPLGAAVFINGEPRGETPQLRIKLAKKAGLLKIEKLGYVSHTEELLLNPGLNHPKNIRLERLLVNVSIKTTPSGAMITIDEKQLGPSPQNQRLETGAHTLKIEKEGYQTEKIPIEFYQNYDKTFVLSPAKYGFVEVMAYPRATVTVDGNPVLDKRGALLVFDTAAKKLRWRVGPHDVKFTSLGSEGELSETVTVDSDKIYRVYANFKTRKVDVTLVK